MLRTAMYVMVYSALAGTAMWIIAAIYRFLRDDILKRPSTTALDRFFDALR